MCLGLVGLTVAVFADVRHFELVDFDDHTYVTDNPHVREGLSAETVLWAFTGTHEGYWLPLTWLSYMADVSWSGFDPGALHTTNLLLHIMSVVLAFWVFLSMTGALRPSALVAAIFAVHPLHVESVAWVAERKDVLSGVFFWLAVAAYVGYVRHGTRWRYVAVMAALACGLIAKPILVALPAVLLCLDVWPLARLWNGRGGEPSAQPAGLRARVVEKIPLAALAAAGAIVTIVAQHGAGAVASLEAVPVARRLANALVSLVWYLAMTAWPVNLAVLYPYPAAVPAWQAASSATLVAAVSWWVWRQRHRPYLVSGWLWFLIMLLPVLGLVQAGSQARADRYTYLAMTGVVFAVVWLARDHLPATRRARWLASLAACGVLLAFATHSWLQVRHWRNTETLFRRALAVTERNHVAHAGLGMALRSQGYLDEAVRHLEAALRIQPSYAEAHVNLGETLLALDRPEEALTHLQEAVRLKPDGYEARLNLATALNRTGDHEAAATQASAARDLGPSVAAPHMALGIARTGLGDLDGALAAFSEAVRLDPDSVDARYNLGLLLGRLARHAEAASEFREVVRLAPESASGHIMLGTFLSAAGQYDEGIAALSRGVEIAPSDARAHFNLGGALLARGRVAEAAGQFAEAVRLAPDVPEFRQALEAARRASGRAPR